MNSGSAMVGDGEEGYPPSMAGESIREAAAHAATPYEAKLSELLRQVAAGTVPVDEATRELRNLPFADLGFAKVDHHRELRQGQCEIVLAEGKSPSQVGAIVAQLVEGNVGPILVSRADSAHREAVRTVGLAAGLQVDEWLRAQAVALRRGVSPPTGTALIVTAGTSASPGRRGGHAHHGADGCGRRARGGRRRGRPPPAGRRARTPRRRRRHRGGGGDGRRTGQRGRRHGDLSA